jgi:hypothetical protein
MFKFKRTSLTIINEVREEIMEGLHSDTPSQYAVSHLLKYSLLFETPNTLILWVRNVIFYFGEGHVIQVSENKLLRNICLDLRSIT